MTATVYNLFTKEIITTEICLDLPSDLPEQLVKLIKRMPEKRDYILSCQNENLPNYVGYCVQYTGKDADRSEFPFPCPNYKSKATVLGLGILNGKEADSFMFMDRKYQVTFNRLTQIKIIYTRSDLVAHDDYIEFYDKNVSINIIYNDNEIKDKFRSKKWEGCPSYFRRVKAYEKLKSLGFKVKRNYQMTRVKFVIFQNELIAIFPDEIHSSMMPELVMSYQHIGQHGPASRKLLRCKAATKDQYSDLLKELVAIGYNDLKIMNEISIGDIVKHRSGDTGTVLKESENMFLVWRTDIKFATWYFKDELRRLRGPKKLDTLR